MYEYEEGNSGFIDQRKRDQVRGNRSLQPTAGGISLKQGGGTCPWHELLQGARRMQEVAAPLVGDKKWHQGLVGFHIQEF